MTQKPITIKLTLSGGKNSIIPKGIVETLLINIRDGNATYHFNNAQTTKALVASQQKQGLNSKYVERIQTCICIYPNMSQVQIVEHIQSCLKELAVKK